MVLNSSISNHQKTCPVKSTDYQKGSTILQIGILTGKVKRTYSKRIVKEVLPSMKKKNWRDLYEWSTLHCIGRRLVHEKH